jgi:hypothetical protein
MPIRTFLGDALSNDAVKLRKALPDDAGTRRI